MNRTRKSGKYRGFPSELNEPPINPLLIHMVAPFVEENNPSFSLQVKVASSQILEIIERANENKNSELVDLEKESNLWEQARETLEMRGSFSSAKDL